MEILKINFNNPSPEAIQKAALALSRGLAVIFPTDTVYGLGVNALRSDAVERLFKIKKRPAAKPVPIIIRDIAMAKKMAFISQKTEKTLAVIWPGPVIIVLERRGILPMNLTANKLTVGLRIPDCLLTKTLMEQVDFPITSTSANFSAQPELSSAQEIIDIFEKVYPRPDLILDAGVLPKSPPSTVLDLTGNEPKILRVGLATKDQLMDLFK